MSARKQVLSVVEIRGPEAIWVLGARAYALVISMALCVAVDAYRDYLAPATYRPSLFCIAAALLCAGSALGVAHFAPPSIANLLFVWLSFNAFGDPVVFLQLLLAATTIYFYTALLKTGAQWMHGITIVAASSGTWFFIWALGNSSAGTPNSWAFTLSLAIAVCTVGALLWPMLTRITASPRVLRHVAERALAGKT